VWYDSKYQSDLCHHSKGDATVFRWRVKTIIQGEFKLFFVNHAVTCNVASVQSRVRFYRRDAMLARVFATATCPSVRLSQTGIVSNWRKLVPWFFHHLVTPRFYLSDAKFHHQILRGSPRTGASNKDGVGKSSDFLALSVNTSKTVADTAKVTIND